MNCPRCDGKTRITQTKPRWQRKKRECKNEKCGYYWWYKVENNRVGRIGPGMLRLIREAIELGKG